VTWQNECSLLKNNHIIVKNRANLSQYSYRVASGYPKSYNYSALMDRKYMDFTAIVQKSMHWQQEALALSLWDHHG